MNFNFAQPSEKLRPYIKQYWGLENILKNGATYTQRIIPSGLPELILYLGHKPAAHTKNRSLEDSFLLNGQQNDFYDILISNDLSIFSILFTPQGVSQFFSLPFDELRNNSVPLKFINRNLCVELESKLSKECAFRQKVDAVEESLFKLLSDNKKEFEFRRLTDTIERIRATKGNIEIDALASRACLSRKQFERVFSEHIGISPKQYLKIIRLQAAIHLKSNHKEISLSELTYENGYYDQSHFIHDFKAMTGCTPKQFFDDCEMPMSDFFG